MQKLIFKPRIIIILITFLAGILRMPYLDKYPPALYSDEVSQGYNAYSILKTGKDEYGKFLPVSFRSFGDWKPPLQTYLMIPTVLIYGLNAYGVRLSGAILGTLTVLLIYFLIQEFFKAFDRNINRQAKNNPQIIIALITSLMLAVSPWHIAQSRSAMLVGVTLFFYILALWLFFKGLTSSKYWILSAAGFAVTIYGYYGMRVTVPLTIIMLSVFFYKNILTGAKKLIIPAIIGGLFLIPLFWGFIKEPDIVFGRAKTVSIFYDRGITLTIWDLQKKDGVKFPPILARFFHNKPYLYSVDILRRFGQHLDGRFLFIKGDAYPPFQIPGMGMLYLVDGLFILLGLIRLIKSDSKLTAFILILITISLFPAALTFLTPSSNRSFHLLIPLMFLVSGGIVYVLQKLKLQRKIIIMVLIFVIYTGNFLYFGYQYTTILPRDHADWWYYGYAQLISYLSDHENQYSQIYISGKTSVPYIYLLFYKQTDPASVKSQIRRDYTADDFGFEHVAALGKYEFPRYFNWKADSRSLLPNSLLVTRSDEIVENNINLINEIKYPNGETAFKVYQIN